MSGITTMSGGTTPINYSSNTGGSPASFTKFFPSGGTFTVITGSGAASVSGPVVYHSSNSAVTVTGASAVDDNTAGNNSITAGSSMQVFAQAGDTVSASAGSTTLFGANSGVTTFSISAGNSWIGGGSGSIFGNSSGANSTLIGGQATSFFNVTGASNTVIGGAAGNTFVNLSKATGPESIFTNPGTSQGNMYIAMGSGAESFTGGGGNSTVIGGTGNDVFGFINGHAGGSETIYNFNSSDNLAFYGYTAPPTEQVVNGNDVMTLSDNTKITFVGIDHKIF